MGSAAQVLSDTLFARMDDVDGEMRLLRSRWPRRELMGKISRRSMMRIFVAYGALAETASVHARSKAAQKMVGYQSKPMGTAQCSNCKNFEAPSSCKIVDGVIAPSGWCRLFAEKD